MSRSPSIGQAVIWVRDARGIPFTTKHVLIGIVSHLPTITVSLTGLSDELGCDVRTVTTHLRALERLHLVLVTSGAAEGAVNGYVVNWPVLRGMIPATPGSTIQPTLDPRSNPQAVPLDPGSNPPWIQDPTPLDRGSNEETRESNQETPDPERVRPRAPLLNGHPPTTYPQRQPAPPRRHPGRPCPPDDPATGQPGPSTPLRCGARRP